MAPPIQILLYSHDPLRLEAWRTAVEDEPHRRVAVADDHWDRSLPDVLVTDHAAATECLAGHQSRLTAGEIAVVAVGYEGPADVVLPADCRNRELVLACRLLAEIVRLRRGNRRHERARKVLTHLAVTDPLTGLFNRRGWHDELQNRCDAGQPLNVVLFDVDHFKLINDELGHSVGDKVLSQVAQALTSAARSSDYAARLGGDEFGLLLSDLPADRVAVVVERIRLAMGVTLDGEPPRSVTCSAGFHAEEEEAGSRDTPDEAFNAASRALQQAKQHGRNQTRC